jgi:S1-C subfamily serine protease
MGAAPADDLRRYTVAIQKAGIGMHGTNGTGVIVNDDGLILTCYHVIGDNRTNSITDKVVDIYFPESKSTKSAEVSKDLCNSHQDIAFLKLKEALPNKAAVANLSNLINVGNKFISFGFKFRDYFEGLSSNGDIMIETTMKSPDGGAPLEVVQLDSYDIDRGMSGAAVLDVAINRVIGIISNIYKPVNANYNVGLAIPTAQIIKACPLLQVNNPRQEVKKQSDLNTFPNPWLEPWMDIARKYAEGSFGLFDFYTGLGKKQAAHWTDFGQEEVEFWDGHRYNLNSKG